MDHYAGLLAKADAFFDAATERGADLRCGEGCTACCRVELSVSPVEAASVRQAISTLGGEERRALFERANAPSDGECVMLRDGRCSIYAARPLVCRTQGLPLAYPPSVVPESTVRGRAGDSELVWCPLNFTARPPQKEDVLDAAVLDEALALVNRAHCDALDQDPLERMSLREIAASPPHDE